MKAGRYAYRWELALLGLLVFAFTGTGTAQMNEDLGATLRRQTQEMLDAIAPGQTAVWDRFMDPDALYTDEEGTVSTKAEMLRQMKPLPAEVSGAIKIIDFRVVRKEAVAIATHLDDEHENYHGHDLHCQYRMTDTWVKSGGRWRLIASQVLALRTDPPSEPLTPPQMKDYVGRYELSPGVTYEIRMNNGALEGQGSGHKPEPLLAEAPDVLFVPGKPRYRDVFKRDPDGRITGFAERREAWDLVWMRAR